MSIHTSRRAARPIASDDAPTSKAQTLEAAYPLPRRTRSTRSCRYHDMVRRLER